ncbi:MAG: hypothetical protein HOO91_03870 [Bacteroidales bacterium]|nr:hypothetical protein [Bacteroidales bacterium]
MKRSPALFVLIFAFNLSMGQIDSTSININNQITDDKLLEKGFYKITQNDSIYLLIKNRSIVKFLDFSNCQHSTTRKAKHKLKKFLDSTETIFRASGQNLLYESKYRIISKDLKIDLNQRNKEFYFIENYTYSLFPRNFFGVYTADYLRVKGQFSIKILNLTPRGKYVKFECNNDYLSSNFNAEEYIHSIIKSKDTIPLMIWFPMIGSGRIIKSGKLNKCIEESLSSENLFKYQKTFSTFPDTSRLICLTYNKYFPNDGNPSLFQPYLEIFFTVYGNNSTILISNGKGYSFYTFDKISIIREFIRKTFKNPN